MRRQCSSSADYLCRRGHLDFEVREVDLIGRRQIVGDANEELIELVVDRLGAEPGAVVA